MKLTAGIFMLTILCVSLADAIEDFMPLDIFKSQIKKTRDKAAIKHEILPPIENGENLTYADGDIERVNDADENDDESAASKGTILSPDENTIPEESEDRDVNEDDENGRGMTPSDKEAKMDLEANKFFAESHEEPILEEKYNKNDDKSYDDGVPDEANNIADIDLKDHDDDVNVGSMNNNDDEWGKEVHDDD